MASSASTIVIPAKRAKRVRAGTIGREIVEHGPVLAS